ncbi:MAG: allantoinase AllB [Microbacteriaceae bacterium]
MSEAVEFDAVLHAASVQLPEGPREAWIGIRDGLIAAVSAAPLDGPTTELAPDEVLIPGIVDSHVHVNEPGRTEWEGFDSATRAAAAGGVTTIVDMPLNSVPTTVSLEALHVKREAAGPKARVDVGFWGGAVPQNLGGLAELWDAGVFGFKCFLAPSGIDEFDHLDTAQLDAALAEIAELEALLIVHAEDPAVLAASARDGGADYRSFVESRPDFAETTAIGRVIEGVRRTGARAHILHLSSAAAVPMLRAARAEGLPITVETCPHYLTIAEEQVPAGATEFKCCPPIRDEANREALWEALLEGVIDVVVTDHSPATAELKLGHGGDFQRAWGGIAGLQTGFGAVWTEARRRGIPLEHVLQWMSRGTAELLGLGAKGRIAVGADADLVAFAPDEAFTVHADRLLHRNPVTAFDGRRLHGVARRAWLAGEPLDRSAGAAPRGRLLSRAQEL